MVIFCLIIENHCIYEGKSLTSRTYVCYDVQDDIEKILSERNSILYFQIKYPVQGTFFVFLVEMLLIFACILCFFDLY